MHVVVGFKQYSNEINWDWDDISQLTFLQIYLIQAYLLKTMETVRLALSWTWGAINHPCVQLAFHNITLQLVHFAICFKYNNSRIRVLKNLIKLKLKLYFRYWLVINLPDQFMCWSWALFDKLDWQHGYLIFTYKWVTLIVFHIVIMLQRFGLTFSNSSEIMSINTRGNNL